MAGGVAAAGFLSVAVVVAALIRYPGLITGVGFWPAIGSFVVVIAGYVATAAGLATRLASSESTASVLVAGATIAASWMVVGLSASSALPGGAKTFLGLSVCVALLLGGRATTRSSSLSAGVQTVGLAALVAGLGLFLLWAGQTVIFAGRPYDAGRMGDLQSCTTPDLATCAVSDSLGSAMMLLLLVPLVSLAAGGTGALTANRWLHSRIDV
jgi:hypothetical protein